WLKFVSVQQERATHAALPRTRYSLCVHGLADRLLRGNYRGYFSLGGHPVLAQARANVGRVCSLIYSKTRPTCLANSQNRVPIGTSPRRSSLLMCSEIRLRLIKFLA